MKRTNKYHFIVFLLLISISNTYAQKTKFSTSKEVLNLYNNSNYKSNAMNKSKSADSYMFMSLRNTVAAFNIILEKNYDKDVVEEYKLIIENIINSSQVSRDIINNKYKYKDKYKGWCVLKENSSLYTESPLYESYVFLRITQFLYQLKKAGWVDESDENLVWWRNTLSFVEENVWNKWVNRSFIKYNNYRYLLRSRTHMGGHWAGIAMYLAILTDNQKIKKQTTELQRQYDLLLKRNLKISNGAYKWNSTYDNVNGTGAYKEKLKRIQDVSHGNHVVLYIVSAYELGNPNWTFKDVQLLANTFKYIIYNKKENTFADKVNGTKDKSRAGWGNFIADGWAKLAAYDGDVYEVLTKFESNSILKNYDQELMFKASLIK